MAKAKFDIKTLELPPVAAKPLYAGVGATDLAVEIVREAVADVQKKIAGYQKDVQTRVAGAQKSVTDFEPKALREQAVTVVNSRVEALSKDAKARRAAVEARVAELQAEAKALPTKVQSTVKTVVDDNVTTVTGTYADLATRGEALVARVRKQESTKATVTAAKTTTAKAKTTKTQAAKATKTTAKKATSTAKKTSAPAKSSAKATTTAAKKTATKAAAATTDAAAKVGDN